MEKKGQIFSLDVLISIVLITVALGGAMRFLELKEFEAKEFAEQSELSRVGNTASELLVNNPAITCKLTDSSAVAIYSLSNCLGKNRAINKSDIGITSGFDCRVEITYGTPPTTIAALGECQSDPAGAKNVFASERNIVVADLQEVPKNEFNDCVDSDAATICDIYTEGKATIKVWKK